jgi:hypothetical protein
MAELGRLQHSYGPQAGTVEQIRTEEAHPNSMRVVIVDRLELPPAYNVVVGRSMVGFKPTATKVTTTDYLAGTEYVRDIRLQKSRVVPHSRAAP